DGKLLAVRSRIDQKIELVEVPSGKVLRTIGIVTGAAKGGPKGAAVSQMLVFSPNGKVLASLADPNTVGLWETATGQRVGTLPLPDRSGVQYAAFSPDGRCLALDLNDGTVVVYELATMQPRATFGKKTTPPAGGGKPGRVTSA